jgi:cytochrome c-type biogenesis protein CcmE
MKEGITGRRKIWILVVAIVLPVAVVYAIFTLFIHSGTEKLTVSEVILQVESPNNKQVRVEGKVEVGSIDWDDKAKVMKFNLTDGRQILAVVYEGIVPDNFKPGGELVVAGKYDTAVFQAAGFGASRSFCSICH